ncbi:rRNA adenine N-6-methyltransferase family protein [Candidatus Vidania fulgoroideorum]
MFKSSERFLINNIILNKINIILNNSNYLEVGSGYGNVTDIIKKKSKNLYIFEINKNFFNYLKLKYKKYKKIFLFNEDFLKSKKILSISKSFNFFSSIPFHITNKFIFKIINIRFLLKNIYIIVQEDFYFNKIINKKKYFYYFFNYFFNIKKTIKIKGNCYFPKVKINTILIYLKKKKTDLKLSIFITKNIKYIFCYKNTKFFRKKNKTSVNEYILYILYILKNWKKIFKKNIKSINNI